MAIGVLCHRPRLARTRDPATGGFVAEITIDRLEAILDRTPCRDLAIRLEQGVEIVLEVGEQESTDACGLEQSHVPGFAAGHVDMGIERDLRSPQRLIHISAPDFPLKATMQPRGGGKG